jgi:iron complex outermembrane receptor protein
MFPAPATRRERRRRCSTLLITVLISISASVSTANRVLGEADEPPPPRAETDAGEPERGDLGELEDEAPGLPVIVTEEVNITAARSPRSVLDVPGNVTVIDRETIDRSSARNVPELLRREAGIFVTNRSTNREGYTAEARGFNNGGGNGGRTLVLIDGRRANEPNGGLPDWAFIPLDSVDRIEVVRGPVNALYGDNAIAGVVQVRTRRPEPGFQGTFRGSSGTYDTEEGSLWLGGGTGPVTASAFLQGLNTRGYRDRADLRTRRADGQLLFDLAGRGELRLAGGYDSQNRDRPGALTEEEMAEDRRQAAPGNLDDFDDPRESWGQLQLDLDLTDQLSFRVNGWHRRRTFASQISSPISFYTLDQKTGADAVEAEFELDLPLWGHRNRTILGGSFLREDIDAESFSEFMGFPSQISNSSDRKVYGVFLQNELNLTEDLLLVLGVRREGARYDGRQRSSAMGVAMSEDFDNEADEWAPKAALTWRIVEPVSVYASYARGFRFPNFDEAFGFFGFSPNLDPEISQSYEVGAKVRMERLTFNVAAYYTNVYDEIFYNPLARNPGAFYPGVNVNIGRVRHRGVEVFASLRPFRWLEFYGSYTYDDVEITRDTRTHLEGYQMPFTPRHRGNAGLRVYLPYGFDLGADALWVGSRPLANDPLEQYGKLPGWSRYDLRMGWRRALTEWLTVSIDATVYNLTGERYVEDGGWSIFNGYVGFYPSPERHYRVASEVSVNW